MKKLPVSFYKRNDVIVIARELIGKVLITNFNRVRTSARIVETEAYVAMIDKASHAFGGRRTSKNEHMYSKPGTAYVYICYGMHQMFNVVTNERGIADAVLIRAVEPIEGLVEMSNRTGKLTNDPTITRGPGNVGKAMGIFKHHSGSDLLEKHIFIADDGFIIDQGKLGISPRIGVASAGKDALLPYRFYIRKNPYVSGKRN